MIGPGHLFVELQDHGLVEQPIVNRILVEMAKEMELPVVATNDAHYLRRDDATGQRALTCIASGSTLEEAQSTGHTSEEMFLKSPDEMAEVFAGLPEALSNTMRVAEMCKLKLKLGEPTLPKFRDASGHVVNEIDDFFKRALPRGPRRALPRTFKTAGQERRREEVPRPTGAGDRRHPADEVPRVLSHRAGLHQLGEVERRARGPGARLGRGLAWWPMRSSITDIDPIPYDLLFERFLNPERVSMPDFDVDFCMDKRDRVIEYVKQKYGASSVGQIATFQQLKSQERGERRGARPRHAVRWTSTHRQAMVPEPVQGKTVP